MEKKKVMYKRQRIKAGYNLDNAAMLIGITEKELRSYESGKVTPSPDVKKRMAVTYLCRVDEFEGNIATDEDVKTLKDILLEHRPKWTPEKNTTVYLLVHIVLFTLLIFQYVYSWNNIPMIVIYSLVQIAIISSIIYTCHINKEFLTTKLWCIATLPWFFLTVVEILIWMTPFFQSLPD